MKDRKTNLWVLTSGRSGSTLLVDFLNKLNFLPSSIGENLKFQNFNLAKNPKRYRCTKAISNHLEKHNLKPDQKTRKWIEAHIPNLKYIRLRRRDTIAISVSVALANKSNIWVVTDGKNDYNQKCIVDQKDYTNVDISLTDKELLDAYNEYKDINQFWDQFVKDTQILDIWYEDFIEDKESYITKMCKYLDYEPDISIVRRLVENNIIAKQGNHLNQKYIERLKELTA